MSIDLDIQNLLDMMEEYTPGTTTWLFAMVPRIKQLKVCLQNKLDPSLINFDYDSFDESDLETIDITEDPNWIDQEWIEYENQRITRFCCALRITMSQLEQYGNEKIVQILTLMENYYHKALRSQLQKNDDEIITQIKNLMDEDQPLLFADPILLNSFNNSNDLQEQSKVFWKHFVNSISDEKDKSELLADDPIVKTLALVRIMRDAFDPWEKPIIENLEFELKPKHTKKAIV